MSFLAKGEEPASPRQCTKCAKPETSLAIPLKWCAKCKSSFYCSRGCQQQDWKVHKKICTKQAAQASKERFENEMGSSVHDFMGGTAVSASGSNFQDVIARSLEAARAAGIDTGEDEDAWEDEDDDDNLDDDFLSKFKKQLAMGTDAFASDEPNEYVYTGEVSNDSLYGGGNPHADFKRFLNKAEKKDLLPAWWSSAKRKECEKVSRPLVMCAIEKSDLRGKYPDNPFIAMELRALAEKVYGPIRAY
ncbi:hypothetical protein FKW77_004997 [Venturia effusa]|uniref:MYND-type domain-containing protein n=1 Tax=Venturia effusa TaxID=50376 RepID=A0A517KZF1_9PEZI|nr:hypothetical protein FKW77_004997 [Venturia effusa]